MACSVSCLLGSAGLRVAFIAGTIVDDAGLRIARSWRLVYDLLRMRQTVAGVRIALGRKLISRYTYIKQRRFSIDYILNLSKLTR